MTTAWISVRLFASTLAASGRCWRSCPARPRLRKRRTAPSWLIESSRFMKVPFGSFMPDRAFVPGSDKPDSNIPTVDLPVNIGVIKCGNELIMYDTGWKQQEYLKMTGIGALGPDR